MKVDEAAKDWTKKLAELSGMWSKQTGPLVLVLVLVTVVLVTVVLVMVLVLWSKEKCTHNLKKIAKTKFGYSLVQQPSSLLGISGF